MVYIYLGVRKYKNSTFVIFINLRSSSNIWILVTLGSRCTVGRNEYRYTQNSSVFSTSMSFIIEMNINCSTSMDVNVIFSEVIR